VKPQYREMLEAVDLKGEPVARVAERLGISANNAAVRLHRARVSLGRAVEDACGLCCRSSCFDCECDAEGRASSCEPVRVEE
jgi:RNA polymerase sigma-70 factor (ECF subfamily)